VKDDAARAIDCQDLVELVTEYLEGTLDDDQRVTVEAHLATCEPCARYVEQMRETIERLGEVPLEDAEALPDPVVQRLLSAFRAEPGHQRST
jgi:anti-sigma factor RsiW